MQLRSPLTLCVDIIVAEVSEHLGSGGRHDAVLAQHVRRQSSLRHHGHGDEAPQVVHAQHLIRVE